MVSKKGKQERTSSAALETAQKLLSSLEIKYASRLSVDTQINRMMVSFQANRSEPQFRWMKYREGFSKQLVEYLLSQADNHPKFLFDPFAGAATSLFTASRFDIDAVGIELLPVGPAVFRARKALATADLDTLLKKLKEIRDERPWKKHPQPKPFCHLKITEGAFSTDTERELSWFRGWLLDLDPILQPIMEVACLGILEEISFTRKDGQFLRWDSRANRTRSGKFNKGTIPSFDEALSAKLNEIISDLQGDLTLDIADTHRTTAGSGQMKLLVGDVFEQIREIPDNTIDVVVTSPPYLNRYDYTRTYALELAYFGVNEAEIRKLRQTMLTCTVEHKPKTFPELRADAERADKAIMNLEPLQAINAFMAAERDAGNLNNSGIANMIDGYFRDLALHLAQVSAKMKPGSKYFMVNDNVRYNGLTLPVDLLLSEIASNFGLECQSIRVLPVGKGNSSQQMRDYGKEEIRKCVYEWKKF